MNQLVAAIDCGTNSIRLLVMSAGEHPAELDRRIEVVQLGQGVDANGVFHPDALARTFAACDQYAAAIKDYGCDTVRFVATSAARDVSNGQVFLDGVRARFGVDAQIISGGEEARLSFAGATSGVVTEGRVLVFDIGGGSTELVVGTSSVCEQAISLDMGAVRLDERFFSSKPPSASQIARARAFVNEALDSSRIRFDEVDVAIGVAGTVTSTAAAVLGLEVYDRNLVHGVSLRLDQIDAVSNLWLGATSQEMMRQPGMHPLRAQVLPAGSIILREIVARIGGGVVTVSETDILDGIAHELLAQKCEMPS